MSLIVEKTVIDLVDGGKSDYYAVVTLTPNRYSVIMSLTFEGYLTPWDSDKLAVEALQRQIDNEVAP